MSPEVAYSGPVLMISTFGWNRLVLQVLLSPTEKVVLPTTGLSQPPACTSPRRC